MKSTNKPKQNKEKATKSFKKTETLDLEPTEAEFNAYWISKITDLPNNMGYHQ